MHVVNQYGWKSIGLVEYRQECALVMDGIREAISRSSNTSIILDIQLRNDSEQDMLHALEQVKKGARSTVLSNKIILRYNSVRQVAKGLEAWAFGLFQCKHTPNDNNKFKCK